MRNIFVSILMLCLSSLAQAQTLTQNPVAQGAVSQADMTGRLEKTAIRTSKSALQGSARGATVDFCWPSSPEEYRTLGKYVLVLVSTVTQSRAELPLRRVYVTVNGRETELVRLSSQISDVKKGTMTFSVLGPYREDGFYLAQAGDMMGEGYLQADFAVHRDHFNLYRLPGTPPDFIKADSNPMPASGAKPDMPALKKILQREYTGFELPAALK